MQRSQDVVASHQPAAESQRPFVGCVWFSGARAGVRQHSDTSVRSQRWPAAALKPQVVAGSCHALHSRPPLPPAQHPVGDPAWGGSPGAPYPHLPPLSAPTFFPVSSPPPLLPDLPVSPLTPWRLPALRLLTAAQCLQEPGVTSEPSLKGIAPLAPRAFFLIVTITCTPGPALVPGDTRLLRVAGPASRNQGLLA